VARNLPSPSFVHSVAERHGLKAAALPRQAHDLGIEPVSKMAEEDPPPLFAVCPLHHRELRASGLSKF